jgi:hypothetical protein
MRALQQHGSTQQSPHFEPQPPQLEPQPPWPQLSLQQGLQQTRCQLVLHLPGTQYCSVTHSPHFFCTVFMVVQGTQMVFMQVW